MKAKPSKKTTFARKPAGKVKTPATASGLTNQALYPMMQACQIMGSQMWQ
jgi:hypothetical protein